RAMRPRRIAPRARRAAHCSPRLRLAKRPPLGLKALPRRLQLLELPRPCGAARGGLLPDRFALAPDVCLVLGGRPSPGLIGPLLQLGSASRALLLAGLRERARPGLRDPLLESIDARGFHPLQRPLPSGGDLL